MAPKDDFGLGPRFIRLEDRLLLNATPEAAVVDLPAEDFINEDFDFTVTFDNAAPDPADIGFGPFVDVTVGPGIEVNGVSFLGSSLGFSEIGEWDGTQWLDTNGDPVTEHPLDDTGVLQLPVGTEVGEKWLNVLAPFGSYTPDQPAIELDFDATLQQSPDGIQPGAEPGNPILVTARGGFQFGEDGLDNPSTDPPVQQAAAVTDDITPIILRLQKDVNLPENETAQGENFPFTYTITVDIADGISITDVRVTDALPQNLFILGTNSNVTPSSFVAPGDGTNAPGVPGRDTVDTAEFIYADTSVDPGASITGTAAPDDIVITVNAYAPETDANNALIIDPDNPQPAVATNLAEVTANYEGQPVDPSITDQTTDSVDITIRPYTVLKSVQVEGGGPVVPGEYLRFTIDMDVSDYLGIQDLVLRDVLSDGLTLDTTDNATLEHTPVLSLTQDGSTGLFSFEEGPQFLQRIELETNLAADGTQELTFFVSNALRNDGRSGAVSGDIFSDMTQDGPTTMTLTYFALIEETYRATGQPVVNNDGLSNTVSLEANSESNPANPAAPDGSQSGVGVEPPAATKSVFAVNGTPPANQDIAPGDVVTYRLRLDFTTLDTNNLVLQDYLPAPVYDVDSTGGFTFVDTQGGLPGNYQIIRGPDDTASGAAGVAGIPTVTTDGASNSVTMTFADFDENASTGGVIDLLYSVPVEDRPFADGLLLVNQAIITTGDSTQEIANTDTIVGEIVLRQPVLELTKGAVATDADGGPNDPVEFDPVDTGPAGLGFTVGTPGFTGTVTDAELAATPISSDLSGFDAGDTVKFAISLVNTGGQDAFDIEVTDIAPTGFIVPSDPAIFDLDVRFGDGTVIPFDPTPNAGVLSFSGDLFNTPLIINDRTGAGSLGPEGGPDGSNVIIISYDLVVDDTFTPGTTVDNEALLENFASIEMGNDFTDGVDGQFTDEVMLTSQGLDLDKRLVTTDQAFTDGRDLAIGEIATFQLEITMPDGTTGPLNGEPGATITDILPAGLAIVGDPILLTTFTNGNGDTRTFDGTLDQGAGAIGNGQPLAFTLNGNDITITFDEIFTTSSAGTDQTGQVFAIQYQVQALDDPALDAGDSIRNRADIDTPTTDPTDDARVRVDIVEPDLSITKTFLPDTAEGGDTVSLVLEIENATGDAVTSSFGLQVTDDDLPKAVFSSVTLNTVSGSGAIDTGRLTVNIDETSDPNFFIITLTGDDDPNDPNDDLVIAPGEILSVAFDLVVDTNVAIGTVVPNTATIDSYTSLPGTPPVERTFGPETGSDTLTIEDPVVRKTLVNTSFTGGAIFDPSPEVFVGEILTYEVSVNFPVGVLEQTIFFDDTELLGTGAGTVEILGISNLFVGDALDFSNRGAGDRNMNGIVDIDDAFILDTSSNGQINRVEFILGTVDADPARSAQSPTLSTTISYTLTAQVINNDLSVDGTTQTNLARVEGVTNGRVERADATFDIMIDEPAIDLTKTAILTDPTPDAGDIVTYELIVSHDVAGITSNAPGFDLNIVDILPNDLEVIAGSATVTPINVQGFESLELSDVTLTPGPGGSVRIDGFDLPLGQTAIITYQARIGDNVVAAQMLENEAQLTYASLPGGNSGASERRDSSDIDFSMYDPANPPRADGSIVNNYGDIALETVTITIPDGIEKTTDKETPQDSVGDYTIGEQIVYTINIPIIEGVTEDATLVDQLPAGIFFVQTGVSDLDSIAASQGGVTPITLQSVSIVDTPAGQQITIEFGDITNPGDNDTTNDFIEVEFTGQVANILGNDNGDQLVNEATFQSTGQTDRVDTATIEIIEPDLAVSKTADNPGPFDAADLITYTIEISHSGTSTSDAFEYEFTDIVPTELDFVRIVRAELGGTDVSAQVEFDVATRTIRSTASADIDIPQGSVLIVEYEARVRDDITPGVQISNTVGGIWTSLDGDNATGLETGERTGSLIRDANDYIHASTLDLESDTTFSIVKTIDGPTTEFAVGDTVTYFLDITVFEGVTNNIVIADSTDAGLRVDATSLRIEPSGFNGAPVSIVNPNLIDPPIGPSVLEFRLDNTADPNDISLVNPGDPFGNTDDNDTIRVAYEAVVENILGNQDQIDLENFVVGAGTDTDIANGRAVLTVVEPNIVMDKQVVTPTGTVDAGDVITYSVTLENDGTSTAFDVDFTDTAPTNTQFVAGSANATDSGGMAVGTITIPAGGATLTVDAFDIPVGETITVTYDVVVSDTVQPGDILINAAETLWTSTSGTNPDERFGTPGGPLSDDNTALNNYAARDSETVNTEFTIDLDKSLIDTSQDNDASDQVLIGETLTWQLELTLTEGTTPSVVITDQLAADMIFTGDVTVTPPAGVTIDFTDPNPVSVDANNLLTIDLGDVRVEGSNGLDDGVDTQILTLTYQTIVGNTTGNQSGTNLPNTATVLSSSGLTAMDADDVTVIEPDLQITKTNDATGDVQAGDVVQFTVTVDHTTASESIAYDFNLSDPVDANSFTVTSIVSADLGGTDVAGQFQVNGNTVETTPTADLDIAIGQTLTLVYEAVVADTIGPNETLTNTATGTWTSLDGAIRSGDPDGERDGSDGPTGLNDYVVSATSDMTTDDVLEIVKSILPTQTFSIGEVVDFQFDITVFEGTLLEVSVSDVIDEGISIDLSSLTVDNSSFAGAPVQLINVSLVGDPRTQDVTLGFQLDNDLGTAGSQVINPGDADDTNNTIRVTFQGTVLNEFINQDGRVASDTVTVTATNSTPDDDTASLTVVEPNLLLDKQVVSPTSDVDAGDIISYSVTLENNGTSTAFDVVFTDVPPTNSSFVSGSATATDSGGMPVGTFVIQPDGSLRGDAFDIPVGETVTITYDLLVSDTISPGDMLTNAAEATWTSTSGANTEERFGTPGGPTSDDPTELNNYAARDSETVDTEFTINLTKALIDTSQDNDASDQVLIGETLTWQLDLELTEGTTRNVVVNDQLAADMILTGTVTVTPPSGGAYTVTPVVDPGTNLVTIDLGDVTIPGTDGPDDGVDTQVVTLTYQTIVANRLANQSGTDLPNTATVTATGLTSVTDNASVTVIEPDLQITKTNDATGDVVAGDTIQFTVTVSHTGASESTAYDFEMTDPVDANSFTVTRIVSADLGGTNVDAQFTVVGNTVETTAIADLDIEIGQTLTLVYEAIIADTIGPNETLTNTATGTWTSLDGAVRSGQDDGERDGSDGPTGLNDYEISASSLVSTDDVLDIEKTILPKTEFTIGETVSYQFDITVLQGTLLEVTISDAIEQGVEVDLSTLALQGIGFAGDPVQIINTSYTGDARTGATTLSFQLDNDLTTAGAQLINPGDTDTTNDTIRVTFDATVLNILENQNGELRSDTVTVSATNSTSDIDDASFTIVEPDLNLLLVSTNTDLIVDAGDVIDLEAVITSLGTSTAFDVDFVTMAPNDTLFTGTVTALDQNNNPIGTFAISPDGRTLTGTGFDLDRTEFVTVVYELTVQDTAVANQLFPIDATVEWTSLTGTSAEERDGSDGEGPSDTVLNNYQDVTNLAAIFDTGPGILGVDKTVIDTNVTQTTGTDVTVGETATYQVRTQVIEGTTIGFILLDSLAPGTSFIDGSVTVTADNPNTIISFDPNTDVTLLPNNQLRVFLGDFVNPGDNIIANDFVNVSYEVVVNDDAANVQDGNALINTATVFANINNTGSDTAQIDVVEPDLVIRKQIVPIPIIPIGGDIDYRITVEHSNASTANAFDLFIEDPYDQNPGVSDIDPATLMARIEGAIGILDPVIQIVAGGFEVTAEELPLGAELIIEYTANTQVFPTASGTLVNNEASLVYDSIPGTLTPDEQRTYTDQDDVVALIAGPDLELVKDAAVQTTTPGDTFDYTISVTNIGVPGINLGPLETATNVVVGDVLPNDLTLVAVTVDGVPATPNFLPDSRAFTLDLGDLPAEQVRIITLTVQVAEPASAIVEPPIGGVTIEPSSVEALLVNRVIDLNEQLRQFNPSDLPDEPSSDVLNNIALVGFDQTDPTPLNNIDNAQVTLLARPDLVVTKTNDVEETGGSEVVPFTITVANQGDRIAADVVIVDRVDTEVFEFVSATDGGVFDAVQGTVTWTIDRLSPEDGQIDFGLVLQVRPGLSSDITETTNRVDVTDNELGGDDPTPENNSDTHTDQLIYPDLVVTKSNSVDEISPGDIVDFTITAQNIGDFVADGVQVVDLVDTNVFEFVSASNGGVFNASTGTVTWTLGTLEAGSSPVVLTLTLEAIFPDNGVETTLNVVSIASDGTRGLEPDLTNNVDTELDIVNVLPDPSEIAAVFDSVFGDDDDEEEEEPELVLISPIVTGIAPAGATVTVNLIGANGAVLQTTTTLAADDGSWFLSFSDIDAEQQPVTAVVLTAPSPLTPRDGLASNNVTFSPGADTPITFARSFEVYSEAELNSATLLRAEIAASEAPGNINARRYVNFDSASEIAINF